MPIFYIYIYSRCSHHLLTIGQPSRMGYFCFVSPLSSPSPCAVLRCTLTFLNEIVVRDIPQLANKNKTSSLNESKHAHTIQYHFIEANILKWSVLNQSGKNRFYFIKSKVIKYFIMADMQNIATLAQPENCEIDATTVKVKAPKRILHFSDGTMEEYSSDEEDTPDAQRNDKQISVVSLNSFIIVRELCDESFAIYGRAHPHMAMTANGLFQCHIKIDIRSTHIV